MTINRELLDQYIYDLGYDEALKQCNLTDQQADTILFGEPERKVERAGRYVEPVENEDNPIWSMDVKDLKRVIATNYMTLYEEAEAYVSKTINKRSMSKYDIFAQGLEKILYSNADFEYVNDEQALSYVRARIKRTFNSEIFNDKYHRDRLEYRDDLLTNSEEMYPEVTSPLAKLDERDRVIVELRAMGYTHEEIAEVLACSRQSITKKLKQIEQKLTA